MSVDATCVWRLFPLLAITVGCGCDVRSRLDSTIRNLQLSSPEMENHIRSRLEQATPTSLESPDLVLGRLCVFGAASGDALRGKVRRVELVVAWLEAFPSATGVRLLSPDGGHFDLDMSSEQIMYCQEEAEKTVLHILAFPFLGESVEANRILGLLKHRQLGVVLTRNGDLISTTVPLRAVYFPDTEYGDHLGSQNEGSAPGWHC